MMKYPLILIALIAFLLPFTSSAQSCIQIESVLVDACDDGFTNPEGLNEMFRFRNGNFDLNISDITILNGWPSESVNALPFNGFVQNSSTQAKTVELNNTIISCGYLLEPPNGIIPQNRKVLAITSFDVSASLNSFANLSDTLYIIYHQHTGEGGGHFLNQNTGAPQDQTLRIQITGTNSCYEEVTYQRALLVNTNGQNVAQNGATVEFSDDGTASYTNTGCTAPIEPFSADWVNPGPFCGNSTAVDLNTFVTGSTGGTWSGTGVTGSIFNPVGLNGSYSVTYSVAPPSGCITQPASLTLNIIVSESVDASFTNPQLLCATVGSIDLDTLVTGTTGGTWSGSGVTGSQLNLNGLDGNIQITYSVGTGTCSDILSQTLQVVSLSPINITGDTLYCNGETPNALSINADPNATVSWYSDPALTTFLSTGNSITPANGQNAGYYAVQSEQGCYSDTTGVTVEFSVVAIPTGDTLLTFCEADPIPLASVQSSTSPITWYSDESLSAVIATGLNYQSSIENDTLYVTATSGACESEALEIIIQQIGLLTAEIITPNETSLCSGQPIELTSAANNQNSWNTGSTASSITVTSAGTYTLTRTGQCNTATDQIIITGIPVTANFTTDVDSGYVILPVNVTDQSVNGETYSWTLNGEPLIFTAPGTLTFPDSGTFVLELVVSNSTGCYDSDSAVIKVLSDKLLLVVPNVFTPNSDGFNDLFQVKYNAVKTFQARVFNRWGKQLYSWENVSTGWDGLHNSEKVPDGTYFFIISGTDIKDQPFEEKGTVTLLGN